MFHRISACIGQRELAPLAIVPLGSDRHWFGQRHYLCVCVITMAEPSRFAGEHYICRRVGSVLCRNQGAHNDTHLNS